LTELTSNEAIVPEIWAYEVANNIFVACNKRKRITENQVREYLGLLKALPIRLEHRTLWDNVDLKIPGPAAQPCCLRCGLFGLGAPHWSALATSDDTLRKAALPKVFCCSL